ncbi:DUF4145 domain-containing protein [Pontibacter sp. HSC-14F20]|uniref:DUF4145 domain-containing protein n=1 Tax=Pontibacter sp. HSC-14F20 TaxID=2864136 RepID=UPI001C735324|nr:DUF4145 domain-containing protein [Pontibacter sp. HSC-14F20]MBX0335563.1 DUF4145 domain-containing protein [Pontibacter sp. HSC-14F20]
MNTDTSNFNFLEVGFPELATTGQLAEKYLYSDPNASLFKTRVMGELVAKQIWYFEGLDQIESDTQLDRIKHLYAKSIIPTEVNDLFHLVRKKGNPSAHSTHGTIEDGQIVLESVLKLCAWFYEAYIDCTTFDSGTVVFAVPTQEPDTAAHIAEMEALVEALSKEKTRLQTELQEALAKESEEDKKVRLDVAYKAAKKIKWTEEETRRVIDQQLNDVGWEADTLNLRFSKGARPEKGKKKAIAEWPCSGKYVDYALFVGEDLVGLVEAKKRGTAISSVVGEAKMYGELRGCFDFI